MKVRMIALAALLLFSAAFTTQPSPVAQSAGLAAPPLSSATAQTGSVGAPVQVQVTIVDQPVPRSPAELQRLQEALLRVNQPAPALPAGNTAVQRPDSVVGPGSASVMAPSRAP